MNDLAHHERGIYNSEKEMGPFTPYIWLCQPMNREGFAMERDQMLPIREVAVKLGVHPQTLRRWEREGAIPRATRRRGQRIYTWGDVERIVAAVIQAPAPGPQER